MTKNGVKTENRLSTLEANYVSLEEKISEIKDNHLVYLASDIKEVQKSIQNIDLKLAYWSGIIVVGIYLLDKFIK